MISLLASCGGGAVVGGSSGGSSNTPGGGPGSGSGSGGTGGTGAGGNNSNSTDITAAICGDNECAHGETAVFCPQDCPVTVNCNNNGQCQQPTENAVTCPADCSRVGGFPNIQRTPGALIAGPFAQEQGRSAILAYHGNTLIMIPEAPDSAANSDYRMRTYSIATPENPQLLQLGEETTHPVNAHGYIQFGNELNVGWVPNPAHPNWQPYPNSPQSAYNHMAYISSGNSVQSQLGRWTGPYTSFDHGRIYPPWYITTYSTYNNDRPNATLTLDGTNRATWDHVGQTGVVGHPFILGNLLIYASDQADSGIATYDISNPASPQLLDVLSTGQIGGYEPEIWGHYMVFPKRPGSGGGVGRMQMVDFSDPSNLRLTCEVDLPGEDIPYVQFQDEFGFINSYKIDMRTCEIVQAIDLDPLRIDCSQMSMPIGNLFACGGLGCKDEPGAPCTSRRQGVSIFAHQATPDIRGPQVSYHIPADGQTNYPVTHAISVLIHETLRTETTIGGQNVFLRNASTGASIPIRVYFTHNDVLTIDPVSSLSANTTYEVELRGIEDVSRNPMDGPYVFRFSTGNTLNGGNAAPAISGVTMTPARSAPFAPGETVIFTANATDAEGSAMQYQFDFGDGSNPTGWLTIASAGHSYTAPGHYTVEVRVRDSAGRVSLEVFTVTVNNPVTVPNQSSQLVCNDGQNRAWMVNPDDDTLSAVDLAQQSVAAEVELGGSDPRSIARDPSGNLWVTLHDDDRIAIIDPNNIGASPVYVNLDYGSAPYAIVMHPNQNLAYVSLFGSGEIARINTSTRAVTGTLSVGPTPRALAMNGDGSRLLVTRFISGPNYGEVWSVNTQSFTVAQTIQLIKDVSEDMPNAGSGVPNYLADVMVSPDGTKAWVTAKKDNTDRGTANGGDALDSDNTVRAILATLDLQAGEELIDSRIDIDNADSPSGMALSPYGDYIFMAMQGNNSTFIFDVFAMEVPGNSGSLVTRLPLEAVPDPQDGKAPQDVCVDSVTRTLVTKNLTGRSASLADLDPLFIRGDFTLDVEEIGVVSQANRVMGENVMRGKRVFYNAADPRMSAEGYMSCASCHIDGTHDGRTWDFTSRGEGLRNTITLQGRSGMGHGDVHWSANFDEIQDFEHDIRSGFGGTGFLSSGEFASANTPLGNPKAGMDADLDAMAAYLTSLDEDSIPKSPHRNANGTLTAAASRGRALFLSAGLNCASCHTLDGTYTDGDRHDVGTMRETSGERLGGPLDGIDTPTLLGLHDTAPYGHDGSSPTLSAFLANTGSVGALLEADDTAVFTRGGSGTNTRRSGNIYGRGGDYLEMYNQASITTTINGGVSGGVAQIRIRYSRAQSSARLEMVLNGAAATTVTTQLVPQVEGSFINGELWLETDSIPVQLQAGNNTLTLRTNTFGRVMVDTVTVSMPADIAAAAAHRRAALRTATNPSGLLQADHDDLIQFLLQLDGSGPFN